jgi:nucleoside-diphosphate-sugar epimerase
LILPIDKDNKDVKSISMIINNKTIFLAGSTGLVGMSILNYLLDKFPNISIRATWNKTKPSIIDQRITYIQANLTERKACQKAIEGSDFAILAAANTGGAMVQNKEPYLQTSDNLVMDTYLLESLHHSAVQKTIYISSATLYQPFEGLIKEEQLDLNSQPHSAYLGIGWAKRSAEKLCEFWHEKYGMKVIIARASNVYGPFAKFNPEHSNFIPALIRKAVDRINPFEVWGSPEVYRDIIFSEDFASAITLLLMENEIEFDIFNVGSGSLVSVQNVVEAALKSANYTDAEVTYNSDAPVTIGYRGLDCSKLKEKFNWEPLHHLHEGIDITTKWWTNNKDRWIK